ncbi:30S ribosomal protein S16 [Candidatus Hodgkinia cicadicola]|nr:30S ribosomal protein S16 [Candidatus Hodgkinia cicadicola]
MVKIRLITRRTSQNIVVAIPGALEMPKLSPNLVQLRRVGAEALIAR